NVRRVVDLRQAAAVAEIVLVGLDLTQEHRLAQAVGEVGPLAALVGPEGAAIGRWAAEAPPDEPVAHAPAVVVDADIAEGLMAGGLLVRLAGAEERGDDLAGGRRVLMLLVGDAEVDRVEGWALLDRRQDAHLDAPAIGP